MEIDATFYAVPPRQTVENWRDSTPANFVFSAKFPQHITHEKLLEDCFADAIHFLESMAHLGGKLGPLLLQFPYFAQRKGVSLSDFLDRLAPFLAALPRDEIQFAVEVRNKQWLCDPLLDLLHCEGVALALIDHPWMPGPEQLTRTPHVFTAPFAYIRWIGDRKAVDQKRFTDSVLDRSEWRKAWVPLIKTLIEKTIKTKGYVNNHYSGYAPVDIRAIRESLGLSWQQPAGPADAGLLL